MILKGEFLELFLTSFLCFTGSDLAGLNLGLRSSVFIYHVKIRPPSINFEKIFIQFSVFPYIFQIPLDWYCIERCDFSHGLY